MIQVYACTRRRRPRFKLRRSLSIDHHYVIGNKLLARRNRTWDRIKTESIRKVPGRHENSLQIDPNTICRHVEKVLEREKGL